MQIRGPARDVRGHLNAGPSYLALPGGMQDEGIIRESTSSRLVNTVGTAQTVGRQGRLTDLRGAMSVFVPIASAIPPAPDVGGTPGERLNLTRLGHRAP